MATGLTGRALRVATVPYAHPYLEAVLPPDLVRVGPPPPAGDPWAPSPWLDPRYLTAHADEVDVVHLHFGYDALSEAAMTAWAAAARAHEVPVVVTVHDLRNPHHATPERHTAHLRTLLGDAAGVLTLTPGAAAEIRTTFGRAARVVPHPALVRPQPGTDHGPGRVGLHLKSLRPNTGEPMVIVAAVLAGATAGGGRLQVDVHDDVDLAGRLPGLTALAGDGALDLMVHARFDDHDLVAYLQGLAVSVLPYRFGTHSGWLEAGHDVGTRIVAPSCGYYADQWDDVATYTHDEEHGLDADSLSRAVTDALTRPAPAAADPRARAAQRQAARDAHTETYAAAVDRGGRGTRSRGVPHPEVGA